MANKKRKDKNSSNKQPKTKKRYFTKLLALEFFLFLFICGAILSYPFIYKNKVFPGVTIGKHNLGGKTYLEALDLMETPINSFNKEGLVFIFKEAEGTHEEKVVLEPTMVGTDIDSSYDIFRIDGDNALKKAYAVGRSPDWWTNLKEQFASLLYGRSVSLEYYFDRKNIEETLKQNFSKLETPPKDARLIVNSDLSFGVKEEEAGNIFNYQTIVAEAENNLRNLDYQMVNLNLIPAQAEIRQSQAEPLLPQAENLLALAPLTISYQSEDQNKSWEINKQTWSTWLVFRQSEKKSSIQKEVGIGLNPEIVGAYLDTIKSEVEVEVKEGKFQIAEGKVVQFQASQPGISLDTQASVQQMENSFIKNGKKESELLVKEKEPEVTIENANNLGIKELVGVGKSNFAGSPRNRRANIKLGAEKLHGILIKPDEEFSLLKALGKFEASEGWLPELVIKGNRTIPEIGGGACQFGTTMFRAALNAGLPITARRNHSYTVSYYYPIGTDATIYDPAPDLKFLNDTGNYLLIQTKIEGDNLIFELWGTKDGRVAEQTTPKLSGWQDPPPVKIIETEDLAPGEEKCTERAHKGVSAEFAYKVTYPNGEIKEETFTSKYKPWQEVCLKGVEKNPEQSQPTSS